MTLLFALLNLTSASILRGSITNSGEEDILTTNSRLLAAGTSKKSRFNYLLSQFDELDFNPFSLSYFLTVAGSGMVRTFNSFHQKSSHNDCSFSNSIHTYFIHFLLIFWSIHTGYDANTKASFSDTTPINSCKKPCAHHQARESQSFSSYQHWTDTYPCRSNLSNPTECCLSKATKCSTMYHKCWLQCCHLQRRTILLCESQLYLWCPKYRSFFCRMCWNYLLMLFSSWRRVIDHGFLWC